MLMFPPETPSRMRATKTTAIGAKDKRDRNVRRERQHRPADRRADLADDQNGLAPEPVGNVPPERCREELAERKRREEQPTTNGEAPKCVTKYGIIGISMLKPTISMNVMPRIGSSLRIMLGPLFDGYSGDSTGKTIRERRSLAPQDLELIGAAQIDARQHPMQRVDSAQRLSLEGEQARHRRASPRYRPGSPVRRNRRRSRAGPASQGAAQRPAPARRPAPRCRGSRAARVRRASAARRCAWPC